MPWVWLRYATRLNSIVRPRTTQHRKRVATPAFAAWQTRNISAAHTCPQSGKIGVGVAATLALLRHCANGPVNNRRSSWLKEVVMVVANLAGAATVVVAAAEVLAAGVAVREMAAAGRPVAAIRLAVAAAMRPRGPSSGA